MENVFLNDWDGGMERPGYEWKRTRLGQRLGGEMIGASIYLIDPGQKSFPYHFHHANEEMLLVLEGTVQVRTPEGEQEASTGDSIIFPTGPEGAHQLINRSEEEARVIMFSTLVGPEIAEYPDSGNVGVFADSLHKFLDGSAESDYFKGEE